MIGLMGFESLRIYKLLRAGRRSIVRRPQLLAYVITMVLLSIFSGACGYALANGNLGTALFVGFSVPTGIRTLLDNPDSNGPQAPSISVDDFDLDHTRTEPEQPSFRHSVIAWLKDYFE
jgi:hypothetical protein